MSSRTRELIGLFETKRTPGVVEFLRTLNLPKKMAPRSSGPFNLIGRRFMGPILECWSPTSGINTCTYAGAAQGGGKSTIGALGSAYRIKHNPLPEMIMGPSAKWAEREISKTRLMPLIDENPVLAAQKPPNLDLYTAANMDMQGAPIIVTGANSPTAIAGFSAGIVWIDEAAKIQKIEHEDAPDAHPIKNALERTKDFAELAFHYLSCTPTASHHPFWLSFEDGSQEFMHVECPHCRGRFPFDLPSEKEVEAYGRTIGVTLPKEYRSLVWDQDARDATGIWSKDKVAASTRYICPHNGCEIHENDRLPMLETVEPVANNIFAAKNNRSFSVSSFYSPRITFGRMATEFLTASQDFFGMEAFLNSWMAKTFEKIKKDVKEDVVLRLKGTHARRTIPSQPALLVLTADPGELATHWMVTAIMPNADLIIIDWGTVMSVETLLDPTFLRSLIYPITDGRGLSIRPQRGYIDSGYTTERVYSVCMASHGVFWPTKGAPTRVGAWSKAVPSSHPQIELYTYSDYQAKSELYGSRIAEQRGSKIILPTDPYKGSEGNLGTIMEIDPAGYPALVHGLSGQKLIMAGQDDVWKKIPWDHYGDCLKIALIASWIGNTLLTQRLQPEPQGRTYDLHH